MAWMKLKIHLEERVKEAAARKGYDMTFSRMDIGWYTVELKDVELKARDDSGNSARFQSVRVEISSSLEPESVEVDGGDVDVVKRPEPKGDGEGGPRTPVSATDISMSWSENGKKATAKGIALKLTKDGLKLTAERVDATANGWTAGIDGVSVSKDQAGLELKAKRVEARAENVPEGQVPTTDEMARVGGTVLHMPWAMTASVEELEIPSHKIRATAVKLETESGEGPDVKASGDTLSGGGISSTKWDVKVKWDGTVGRIEAESESLTYGHWSLASEEVRTGKVSAIGKLDLSNGKEVELRLDLSGANADVKASRKNNAWALTVKVPEQDCQKLMDAVPRAMMKVVDGAKMTGKLSLNLKVEAGGEEPKVSFKMKNGCKILPGSDSTYTKMLSKQFEVWMPGVDGKEVLVKTGPGSESWTPIGMISQYMPMAVMTTEDPGFMRHHGFSVLAIENSIRENLKEGRMARGASTISMQLVKNLWLGREKTASRKIQEAILTMHLEQTVPKDKILETYLNVVEFGPGTYGVKNGAKYWFKASPAELTLSQSLVLSLMLPRPSAVPFGPDGKLSQSRLQLVRRLIKGMKVLDQITEEEMKIALREVPHRGKAKPDIEGTTDSETTEPDLSGWE